LHALPDSHPLREGDLLTIDAGAERHGFQMVPTRSDEPEFLDDLDLRLW